MPGIAERISAAQDAVDELAATVDTIRRAQATTIYVGDSNTTPITVARMLADYPASAGNLGKYARVTDLYGGVDEILRCRYDGVAYRWVPQRENFNVGVSATTGVFTIRPLLVAPTIRFTSTLTGNVNAALSPDNAYVGQRQRIIAPTSLGLSTMMVSGLLGAGTVPLLQGGVKDFEYSKDGWFLAT